MTEKERKEIVYQKWCEVVAQLQQPDLTEQQRKELLLAKRKLSFAMNTTYGLDYDQ